MRYIITLIFYNQKQTSMNKINFMAAFETTDRNAWRKGTTYRKLTDEQKRVIIAQKRQHGDFTAVAKEMNYTPAYVSQVASGRERNQRILNRIYNKVRGRKTVNA